MMIKLRIVMLFLLVFILFTAPELDHLSNIQRSLTPQLFHPSTSLSTVTPYSQNSSEEIYQEQPEKPLENSNFSAYNNSFKIDDTDKISETPNLKCKPSNFGYSIKQGNIIFPNATYSDCADINEKNYPIMNFDYENNVFTMECVNGKPYYILEPNDRKGRLFNYNEITEILHKRLYEKPVKLTNEEYVYGSCDGNLFNNALHYPRFKPELHKNAKEKMKSLNITNKPLIVMLLTVDSYSRRHFFRKLLKTVEFLNSLNPSFAVFDFKLHNEFGASSVENMVPIFTGKQLNRYAIK